MSRAAGRLRRLLGKLRRGETREELALRAWLALPPVRRRLRRRARRALEADTLAFVCFGNICRSPFAEHLIRDRLGPGRAIVSAGSYPEPDRRSPEFAVAAARRWGVDLTTHRSRVLDERLVNESEAIFVFDLDNYRQVLRACPAARRRVHFVGALGAGEPLPIPDPWGGPYEGYEVVYRRIAELIDAPATPLPGRGSEPTPSRSATPS